MTLKGQKNHYNVKFLRGYGHSISAKNSKIILKDNHDPFSEPDIETWPVKNMPYEKIVMQGKGYISTEVLSLLSDFQNVCAFEQTILCLNSSKSLTTYL